MKKSIIKKLFIKLSKILGYEIIDQSDFSSPTLQKELNEDLSIINEKSIVLPLGEVKITKKGKWPFAQIASKGDSEIGDWCFAIGHPGGFNKKRGVVVRLGRIIGKNEDTLQSDSRLLGGDSGGPLFDFNGNIRIWGRGGFAPPPPSLPLHQPASFYFQNNHKYSIYSWGVYFFEVFAKSRAGYLNFWW